MMPWPSSSVRAVSLVHQLPFTTNYTREELAKSARQAARGSGFGGAGSGRTHLVLSVKLGQLDRLLEDAIFQLELDCLPPVIEGASHVDIIGGVFPGSALTISCSCRQGEDKRTR